MRRRVAQEGGFATILSSGEPTGGAVILVLRARDGTSSAYARTNLGDGSTEWRPLVENDSPEGLELAKSLERQLKFDPDLWVIELDIADPARFIAELGSIS